MPGRGGIARIVAAFRNTIGGLREGLSTEAAIKQEFAIACACRAAVLLCRGGPLDLGGVDCEPDVRAGD